MKFENLRIGMEIYKEELENGYLVEYDVYKVKELKENSVIFGCGSSYCEEYTKEQFEKDESFHNLNGFTPEQMDEIIKDNLMVLGYDNAVDNYTDKDNDFLRGVLQYIQERLGEEL